MNKCAFTPKNYDIIAILCMQKNGPLWPEDATINIMIRLSGFFLQCFSGVMRSGSDGDCSTSGDRARDGRG